MSLAQDNYPKPNDTTKSGERKYKTFEEMTPDYVMKLGTTSAVKDVVKYVNSAEQTIKDINKRKEEKNEYDIGA